MLLDNSVNYKNDSCGKSSIVDENYYILLPWNLLSKLRDMIESIQKAISRIQQNLNYLIELQEPSQKNNRIYKIRIMIHYGIVTKLKNSEINIQRYIQIIEKLSSTESTEWNRCYSYKLDPNFAILHRGRFEIESTDGFAKIFDHDGKEITTNAELAEKSKMRTRVCKCSTSEFINMIIDTKYEVVNVVDEGPIYSPEHESKNQEYGPRTGQVYVKSDLIEKMIKESFRNV